MPVHGPELARMRLKVKRRGAPTLVCHTARDEVCDFYLAHKLVSYAKDCCSVDDPTLLARRYSRVILHQALSSYSRLSRGVLSKEQCFAILRY
jgi:hypothetical protein